MLGIPLIVHDPLIFPLASTLPEIDPLSCCVPFEVATVIESYWISKFFKIKEPVTISFALIYFESIFPALIYLASKAPTDNDSIWVTQPPLKASC